MKNNLIKQNKNMTREILIRRSEVNGSNWTDIEQVLDYNEDEIIITAAIKFNIKDKKNQKLLLKMEDKQISPLVQILKRIENENRHDVEYGESGARNFYFIPDEIKDKIDM